MVANRQRLGLGLALAHQLEHLLNVPVNRGQNFGFRRFGRIPILGFQAVPRFQDAIPELHCADDAQEFHIVGLPGGLARGLVLQDRQMEGAQLVSTSGFGDAIIRNMRG